MSLDMRGANRPAPAGRRVLAQTSFDLRNAARNGENLLLTMVIPVATLIILLKTGFGSGRTTSEALVVTVSLAVLATAFTSQAIGTGFDRRYGVLRMLGLSPLGARGLIAARTLVSVVIITAQLAVLGLLAALVAGWRPTGTAGPIQAALAILLAVWAYTAWALLLAGTLRAEATLAAANAVFLVLMFGGGLIVPAAALPWGAAVEWLPPAALISAMTNAVPAWQPMFVLLVWALVGTALANRRFRWQG